MERYDLGEGAAIALLKRISMQTQVKVHDLAAQVLAGVALEELQRPGLARPSPGAEH